MRDVKMILNFIRGCVLFLGWFVVTVWLGARVLWQAGVVVSRWRKVFGRHLHCTRGHATAAYGVYECRCGAVVEDWVFARCRVCAQTAGWTPCTSCGLPIKNPLLV